MISLTETSTKQLSLLCSMNNVSAIRLTLKSGGCAGIRYEWLLEDVINLDDFVVQLNSHTDNKLVISKDDLKLLRGSIIDYIHESFSSYFSINNPAAIASCGCNNSFKIEALDG